MLHFIRTLGALLAVGPFALAPASEPASPRSRARLLPPAADHDFGRVAPRAQLAHSITFTNTGDAVLRLDRFERSCSCVEPAAQELVVAPGGVGRLEVAVQAGDPSGPFTETLTFATNDPDRPSATLTYRGVVFRWVEAVPDFVVLPITPDSPADQSVTVRIVNHGETPVELGEPRGVNPAFAARLRPRVRGREYELEFRTTRPLPNGNHYGRFTIPTTSPQVPEVPVTVFVPGLAAVVVTPATLELPARGATSAVPFSRVLLGRSTTDHRIEISDPAIDVPGVRVRSEVREAGRLVAVHLDFPRSFEPTRGFRSEVTLKTNHPRFPTLRIPVVTRP